MRLWVAVAVLFILPAVAESQVVPEAGTTDVTLTFSYTHIYAHTGRNGPTPVQHNIDLRAVSANLAVEHSVTDRLAVGFSLPYIRARYRGPEPHPGIVIDDGSMHGSVQDLQFDARYALVRGDFLVTPFAAFRYPATDYETMGHTAPGRGLKELEMGVSAGHQVMALPNAVISATGSYVISEAVRGMRVNRAQADLQLGYVVTSRLFVRAFGAWRRSFDGLDIPVPESSEWFHHHDQLARSNHTRAGAALIVSVAENVSMHVGYTSVLESSNSHMGRSFSVGTSWSFAPRTQQER